MRLSTSLWWRRSSPREAPPWHRLRQQAPPHTPQLAPRASAGTSTQPSPALFVLLLLYLAAYLPLTFSVASFRLQRPFLPSMALPHASGTLRHGSWLQVRPHPSSSTRAQLLTSCCCSPKIAHSFLPSQWLWHYSGLPPSVEPQGLRSQSASTHTAHVGWNCRR